MVVVGVEFLYTPLSKLSTYQHVMSTLKRHLFLIFYMVRRPVGLFPLTLTPLNSQLLQGDIITSIEDGGYMSESQSSKGLIHLGYLLFSFLFSFYSTRESLIQQVHSIVQLATFIFFLNNTSGCSAAGGPESVFQEERQGHLASLHWSLAV